MANLVRNENRGFLIIETMVSLAIVAILLISFDLLINQSIKTSRVNEEEFRANLYLREGIEIAKDLELTNWNELVNCSNPCYPSESFNRWKLNLGKEDLYSDFYHRKIYISDVPNSGDFPANVKRKKVRVEICWQENCSIPKYLETYVYHQTPTP